MEEMTKRERLMAAINGEPVDRVPASYYNHNHPVEYAPDKLIPALLQHQEKFDWDFVKVMLRASYYLEAWGCKFDIDPVKGAILKDYVVKEATDYLKLERLDPTQGRHPVHEIREPAAGSDAHRSLPGIQGIGGGEGTWHHGGR